MDKNEVITISSDDESDFTHLFEQNLNASETIKPELKHLQGILKSCLVKTKNISLGHDKGVTIQSKRHSVQIVKVSKVPQKKCKLPSPEVVDLEDCSEKSVKNGHLQLCSSNKISVHSQEAKIHSKLDVVDIEEIPNEKISSVDDKETNSDVATEKSNKNLKSKSIGKGNICDVVNENSKLEEQIQVETQKEMNSKNPDPNLKLFTEFVEFCGSLEEIQNDRARLTKKLMKRYGEAECSYIKSEEFRNVIQKCKNKVNKDNLYLIAKEITDELSYRKGFEINTDKTELSGKKSQNDQKVVGNKTEKQFTQIITTQSKKWNKILKKIIKKLNNLGNKIKELETTEVDLSDEEGSSYVQLQRYRERFCQIYRKLCKYTNEVADADRVFDRKICFTESKYPKINKCIENWLNKTKRFPDFSDVMKLLESQSTSLGLPSNKESIRVIAIEIFQQVGAMLQRRRKYDLWDSFCGFLDEGEDPAMNDPALEQVLKQNFQIRVKKEQDIFQHYVELQEKEKLEPEEVPDEDANHSPFESGNEDEKEIEDIENSITKRLDDAIEKDTEENEINEEMNNAANEKDSTKAVESDNSNSKSKESKNNYKNCKSLKWRLENGLKSKSESTNSEDSNAGTENEKENETINEESTKSETKGGDNDSDLELIPVDNIKTNTIVPSKPLSEFKSLKRGWCLDETVPKRRKYGNNECDVFEIDCENESPEQKNDVFEVRCCQIFADNVFEDLEYEKKKDWKKRKVFRDLTNVNRLMELHGRKQKMSGLFSPSFFHKSFCEFEKPSWRKRFKVSFRLVGSKGLKCALNQDDKSEKIINSDSGGEPDEKDIENNSEGGKENDEGKEIYSGKGNGSEEDNNEDENKKNGRDKNEHEEEEDEDDNESEKEDDNNEHSFQKTEPDLEKTTVESEKIVKEAIESVEKKERDDAEEKQEIVEENPTSAETECNASENSRNDEKEDDVEVLNVEAEGNEKEESSKEEMKEVKDSANKHEEAVEVEELEQKSSVCNEKQNTNSADITTASEITSEEISNGESSCIIVENQKNQPITKYTKPEKKKRDSVEIKETTLRKSLRKETISQKTPRRNTPSTSDEERVKRFLLHSPSSISITPPRKLTLSKPPSQAAMQALATLRNLKGISATIVRGKKPKNEDEVVVIGVSHPRHTERKAPVPPKRKRNDLPVISNVQSIDTTTPKIVTVEGNVSGFENSWPEVPNNSQCNSSSIRISNVWGSLPNNFMPSEAAGCSSRQSISGSSNVKKKNTKKTVEYVVLD